MARRHTLILGLFASGMVLSPTAIAAPEIDLQTPELPLTDEDAWAMKIDRDASTVTHDLTGFECPFSLPDGYNLESVAQYALGGEDVGCNYVQEGRRAYITYYLSWYGRPAGSKEQAEAVIENLRAMKTLSDEVISAPVSLSLGQNAIDCHYIELVEYDKAANLNTAVRTCSVGGWVYKTRMTWHPDEPIIDADLAFQTEQPVLGNTLSACAAAALPETDAIQGDTSSTVALALVISLAADDLETTDPDGNHATAIAALNTTPDVNSAQCVLDAQVSDTYAYVLGTPAKTPISSLFYTRSDIYSRDESPLLRVSGVTLGELVKEDTTYTAWTIDSEGTDHIIDVFETLPTANQMQHLLVKVLNGKAVSLGSYARKDDGGSTISLPTAPSDETENTAAED